MPGAYGDERVVKPTGGVVITPAQGRVLLQVRKARDLLAGDGAPGPAAEIDDRLAADPQRPVVVVVGEAKRGKSSLVNALLGVPNLTPVDADIATARPLRVVLRAPDGAPSRSVVRFSDGRELSIGPAEVHRWVTGQEPDAADGGAVEAVEVEVDAPRLQGAVLVDTPGAGGLDGGHVRLALLAARRAGVLVLVTTAGQPLTRPELDFLRQASEGVDAVVLVVTRIDTYAAIADTVVAENRTLLRTHAERLAGAPIVEVSSRWAELARSSPDDAELAELSGVPRLVDVLEDALTGLAELHVRNAVRSAVSALDRHLGVIDAQLAAARLDPGVADAARAERTQLAELRAQESRWTMELDRDLQRVRSSALETLTTGANRLRDDWQARLEKQRAGYKREVAEQVTAALQADLAELRESVTGQLRAGLERVVGDLVEREVGASLLPPREGVAADVAATRAPSGFNQLLDPSVISTSMIGAGLGAKALTGVAGISALGIPLLPIVAPLVAGAALVGLTTMYKQVQLIRRRQVEWAGKEIERTRQRMATSVQDAITELKPDIAGAFRAVLTAQIQAVESVVREADTAARRDAGARQQRVTALAARRAAAVARRDELTAALAPPS
jgi:hypothetical protein